MDEKEIRDRLEARNTAYIEFLTELNEDRRKDSFFQKVILGVLIVLLVFAIAGIIVISIRCQNRIEAMADKSEARMYDFISQYDFDTSYNLDSALNDNNSGNINITRN